MGSSEMSVGRAPAVQRVALVVEHLNARNGADLVGREIFRALDEARVPLTVVSRDRYARPAVSGEPDSTRWLTLPSRDRFPGRLSRRTPRLVAKWTLNRLRDVPRRRALARVADGPLVVNGFANSFVLGYRRPGVTSEALLVVHDSPTRYDLPGQPPLSWAVAEMSPFSHYVFNSEAVRSAWSRFGEIARKPSRIIPNCCREDEVLQVRQNDRDAARRHLGWAADRVVAVCVASLQPRKGQDLLVRALPCIRARVPGALLAFVGAPAGPDGERFARSLADDAARAGCGDQVLFMGFRDDALACLRAADLLVLPSRSESMPLTILEAMVMKTPVIASNVDGVSDLVVDRQTGRLVPSDAPDALADAVVALASDPAERAALAEAGHERYWSRFSRTLVDAMYVDAVGRLARGESWS